MIYVNWICFARNLKKEIKSNPGIKIKVAIFLYRVSSFSFNKGGLIKFASLPVYICYRIYSELLVGMELPVSVKAGEGLRIYHGMGIVIHPNTKIGNNCTLRQGVTIGNKISRHGVASACPIVGDDVEIGAGAVIIGPVTINDGAIIGANVVVTKDIPANSVVVGQQMRFI